MASRAPSLSTEDFDGGRFPKACHIACHLSESPVTFRSQGLLDTRSRSLSLSLSFFAMTLPANRVDVSSVGKYMQLTQPCAAHETKMGDWIVVSMHIAGGSAGNHKTDLLIIDEGKWEEAKSKASTMPIADFKRSYARFERNNLSNNSLASMVGAGKWQALFKDATDKVAFADLVIDRFLDKEYTLTVPCIDSSVEGGVFVEIGPCKWKVTAPGSGSGYLLVQSVEEGSVEEPWKTRVSVAWLRKAVTFSPSFHAVKVDFEIVVDSDVYPLCARFLQEGRIKARAAIAAISGTGAESMGSSIIENSSKPELKRAINNILGWLEPILMDEVEAGGAVHPVAPSELVATFKELCAKHSPSVQQRTGAVDTVRRVSWADLPSSNASTASPDVIIIEAGFTAQPWVNAFRRAASSGEFEVFVRDIIDAAVPNEARRTLVLKHKETTLSAIESWLVKIGNDVSPSVINELVAGSQSSGQLISRCLAAEDEAAGQQSNGSVQQPSTLGRHITFRTDSGGGDLSSEVLRERSTVQSDLHDVEADKQLRGSVQTLTAMAKEDSHAQHALLCDDVRQMPDGAIRRLLYCSVDVHSVTADVEPSLVQNISTIRAVLDASLERAVHGRNTGCLAERQRKVLKSIRLGKLSAVRLLHLIDQDDAGTTEDPLKGVAKLPASDRASTLGEVLMQLQQAWIYSAPKHSGEIMQFVTALTHKIVEGEKAGMAWSDLSIFYARLMRRVCQKSDGFAGRVAVATEAPDRQWVKDTAFEWVSEFQSKFTVARCTKACAGMFEPVSVPNQSRKVGGEQDEKPDGKGGPKQQKKQKKRKAKKGGEREDNAKAQDPDKDDKGDDDGPSEQPGTKRKKVQKELNDKLGKRGDKWPCFFHHHLKKCNFSADDCRNYHD